MQTVELSYQQFGSDGPPLVILHGLFGSGRNWYSFARNLAQEYKVFVPDLRGHGDSPKVPPLDYPHMAADVAQLLAGEGLASAHLLGHSMGGKVAMYLALTRPALVDRLVVVDIAPVQYSHNFYDIIETLKQLPLDQITSRSEADAWLESRIENAAVRQFLLQNLVAENDHYHWRIDFDILEQALPAIAGFPQDSELQPFEGPTLFIAGGHSEYIKTQYHPAIRSLFPNALIKTIEDAGHWLHQDQPERFLEIVRCFLRKASSHLTGS